MVPILVLVYVEATSKIIQIQENQGACSACQFIIGSEGMNEHAPPNIFVPSIIMVCDSVFPSDRPCVTHLSWCSQWTYGTDSRRTSACILHTFQHCQRDWLIKDD